MLYSEGMCPAATACLINVFLLVFVSWKTAKIPDGTNFNYTQYNSLLVGYVDYGIWYFHTTCRVRKIEEIKDLSCEGCNKLIFQDMLYILIFV